MFTCSRKDPRIATFGYQIEKDPKEQKDSPDEAPESGDKLPE
ncbi:hypothetical protein [Erwinia sp. CGal63]